MQCILNRRSADQQVTRKDFAREVNRIVERDDAFLALPVTVLYLAILIYLITGHLRIYDRRSAENSLEEFINGRDPRETADENIDDISSLWEWYLDAGLRGPLADVKNSTDNKYKWCMLASRHVLVGDVELSKKTFSGEETSVWLLKSAAAQAYLASNPYEYQKAALETANELKANGWDSDDIEQMWLQFSTYNEFTRCFAITKVLNPLPKLGNVHSRIDSSSVSIEPYPSVDIMIADALFCLLVLWIFVNEFMDAAGALWLGFGEFKDYLGLWNVVDWINIALCWLQVAAWIDTVSKMNVEAFSDLMDDDYKINVDLMALTESELTILTDALQDLRVRYWFLQLTMAINTVSVVAKFFKSFQSNVRLKTVSDTFSNAFVDFCHFIIMFVTIFVPFVIIGHILFGSDLTEFASVTASINTGIMCLFGEFEWFLDESPANFASQLPSGMPKIAISIWFVTFMFMIFLVLLNILLAIIIEHYTEVFEEIEYEVDKPPVWKQAWAYWLQSRDTRGFLPLEHLRNDLENDENPAHPEDWGGVTVATLQKAWPKMGEDQAAWLMKLLDSNCSMSRHLQQKKEQAQYVRAMAENNRDKLNTVTESVGDNKKRLDYLEEQKGGGEDMTDGLQKIALGLEELGVSLAKVRREHDRLSRRVDDVVRGIPDGYKFRVVAAPDQPRIETKETVSSSSGNSTNKSVKPFREWKKAASSTTTSKLAEPPSSRDRQAERSKPREAGFKDAQSEPAASVSGQKRQWEKKRTKESNK
jgi:hypothetical protein